ncbi:hypothetical protein [Amycolatopsis alba]|uniref:Lipoprotein n=1 Tax=Amycolatopsis alba DSM 44262 TaxID=1125972 RepID=A0A229RDI8_AMYAL|nr:hypothetical protein [Amycolatopsis alba]OXM44716.1 hypothetical protein CFP75_33580 [Amycolatopsis alba DSM 44262]
MIRRASVAALVFVLSACGTVTPPPAGPETVLLRAKAYVGMPSPKPALLPEFSLYGGGRLLVPGEPEGSLQVVSEKRLDDQAVRDVYSAAHGAGLDRDEFVPDDSGTTDGYLLVFTLYDKEGKRRQVRAENPSGELAGFRDELADVAKEAETVPKAYRPTRIAAIGWASDSRPAPDARPWPFAPFGTRPVDGGLCVVLEGESARRAEDLAKAATPATRWKTADTSLLVVFRPLLPDEKSCDDLVIPYR